MSLMYQSQIRDMIMGSTKLTMSTFFLPKHNLNRQKRWISQKKKIQQHNRQKKKKNKTNYTCTVVVEKKRKKLRKKGKRFFNKV